MRGERRSEAGALLETDKLETGRSWSLKKRRTLVPEQES